MKRFGWSRRATAARPRTCISSRLSSCDPSSCSTHARPPAVERAACRAVESHASSVSQAKSSAGGCVGAQVGGAGTSAAPTVEGQACQAGPGVDGCACTSWQRRNHVAGCWGRAQRGQQQSRTACPASGRSGPSASAATSRTSSHAGPAGSRRETKAAPFSRHCRKAPRRDCLASSCLCSTSGEGAKAGDQHYQAAAAQNAAAASAAHPGPHLSSLAASRVTQPFLRVANHWHDGADAATERFREVDHLLCGESIDEGGLVDIGAPADPTLEPFLAAAQQTGAAAVREGSQQHTACPRARQHARHCGSAQLSVRTQYTRTHTKIASGAPLRPAGALRARSTTSWFLAASMNRASSSCCREGQERGRRGRDAGGGRQALARRGAALWPNATVPGYAGRVRRSPLAARGAAVEKGPRQRTTPVPRSSPGRQRRRKSSLR